MNEPIKTKKISGRDRAYSYVRNIILSDPETAGTFLNEQELADRIGVSRTPVREALFMLATENLLQLVPNRGALVIPPSPDEIRQVMQAREMIEVWSVRHRVADHARIAATLEARVQAQRDLPNDAEFETFIELDRQFHLDLIRFSGNPVLSQMYEVLQARHITLGIKAMKRSAERLAQVLAEHQAIVDALAAGDLDRIEAAIRAHLDMTFRSLVLPV
ncbi:GntR family transcriptional regulator [Methylobacterium sp. 17Sr1-1]|nr:GntR family transcriptional regulator [Methylobacterium sp. 17Sr1-1]